MRRALPACAPWARVFSCALAPALSGSFSDRLPALFLVREGAL